MANLDAPFGFLPVDSWDGSRFPVRVMTKDASDTASLGVNDLVDLDGTADGATRGAAGGPFYGVSRSYAAASTASTHPVIRLTPYTICAAQESGSTVAANEGFNANVTVAVANATSGMSQMEIDSSTDATTSTLDLRLLRPIPYPGNTVASSNCDWFVVINDLRVHDLKAGV